MSLEVILLLCLFDIEKTPMLLLDKCCRNVMKMQETLPMTWDKTRRQVIKNGRETSQERCREM
jgi:hypothetical protein